MFVVTGASGQLGQGIVKGLLARVSSDQIVASVRDPEKVTAFTQKGVHVRQADFSQPATLAAAFSGAEQVLIVSVDKLGETALQMHHAAINAAREAGAKRILYTSHAGARKDSSFAPAVDHATVEDFLRSAGASFTALRHGFYAESALHMIGQGIKTGEIRVPEDGPVSWTARADLAEVDAILLAEDGRLDDGVTPSLTANEAVTMTDLAAIASEITGRTIKRVIISDDEFCAIKIAEGVPEPMARMFLGMFHAARRGDFSEVDPTLETLLGRKPKTIREVLAGFLWSAEV